MMRKIKVIVRKQERLIISLPQQTGLHSANKPDSGVDSLVVVPNRIRIQNRRFHVHHQTQNSLHYHQSRSALLGRAARNHLLSARRLAASQNWEQVVEDRAKMIEMHAF